MLEGIFLTVVNMSIIGSLAIILILAVRLLLIKAPKVFSYCLWAVVLFRLLAPFSFDSVVSLIPINKQPVPLDLVSMQSPAINTGIVNVDEAISSVLPSVTNIDGTSKLPLMITIMESIWMAVVLAMVVFGFYSLFKLRRKLCSASYIGGNIYQSKWVDTPFVLGIINPKIYLPTGLNEIEKEYIILHELNHIRRGDHIIRLISYLALCIHWFNPLVWIAYKTSGKDMEMANDESVIRKKGDAIKKDYSSSLLTLSTRKRGVSPMPLAFGEEDPKRRIKNIINYKKPMAWAVVAAVVVVVSVSTGLLLSSDKDNLNAQQILQALNKAGYPSENVAVYIKKGSNDQYPWSIKGCTSAVTWSAHDGIKGGDSIGAIEVFNTPAACADRRNYIKTLSSFYSPDQEYFVQAGMVFIRIPTTLTTTEAAQFELAIKAMAEGKLPDPYIP